MNLLEWKICGNWNHQEERKLDSGGERDDEIYTSTVIVTTLIHYFQQYVFFIAHSEHLFLTYLRQYAFHCLTTRS